MEVDVEVEPELFDEDWRGCRAERVELPRGAARVRAARARVARRKRMAVWLVCCLAGLELGMGLFVGYPDVYYKQSRKR